MIFVTLSKITVNFDPLVTFSGILFIPDIFEIFDPADIPIYCITKDHPLADFNHNRYTLLYISNDFISNTRLKLAIFLAKLKQDP